jgi:hypothetical protein
MVAPVGSFTNILNSGLTAAGGLTQSIGSLSSNANLQNAITQSAGNSASVAAQLQASREQDANGARLIALQSEETQKKQTTDVLNAIESGKEDSTNKKISASAQNAKGISY